LHEIEEVAQCVWVIDLDESFDSFGLDHEIWIAQQRTDTAGCDA
jgi:hypothetical protein